MHPPLPPHSPRLPLLPLAPRAVVALHEPIAEYLGVPPVLVQFMFALIALVVSAAMLVVCAVASGPGGLRGRPREHAD